MTRDAEQLPIAGIVPLSTVDWPGRLVATVFVQGCPWRCTYCHNRDLLDCARPGARQFGEVTALLARRRGLLDGVCFSGGEATRHPALEAAMREVRDLGFAVGLHTGGAYPRRLAQIAPLLSWVGFDVKGLPEDYPRVAKAPAAMGERAWAALAGLTARADGPLVEVRLTVYPGSHSLAAVRACVRRALEGGAATFALQQARTADGAGEFGRGAAGPSFDALAAVVREIAGEAATVRAIAG